MIDRDIQKIVTEELKDWILCIFGPTDEDGCFQDLQRVRYFMMKTGLMEIDDSEELQTGHGLLEKKVDFTMFVKARYEDIFAKLCDTRHEYTFDEFGEALIALIIEFAGSDGYWYLRAYSDNSERFAARDYPDKCAAELHNLRSSEHSLSDELFRKAFDEEGYNHYLYLRLIDRGYYDDEFIETLKIEWQSQGEEMYAQELFDGPEEVMDRIRKGEPVTAADMPRAEIFGKAYAELFFNRLFDVSLYGFDILENTDSWITDAFGDICDINGESGLNEDEADMLESVAAESIVFWDTDYEIILESLESGNLDTALRCVGKEAGMALQKAEDIFKTVDTVEDIK